MPRRMWPQQLLLLLLHLFGAARAASEAGSLGLDAGLQQTPRKFRHGNEQLSMAPAAASRYSYIPTSKEPRSGLLPPSALVWKVNHSGGPSSGPLAAWRVGALAGA